MYQLLRSIERFHNAVEIEIFGSFIDTNLPPCPKNFSGANDVPCASCGNRVSRFASRMPTLVQLCIALALRTAIF